MAYGQGIGQVYGELGSSTTFDDVSQNFLKVPTANNSWSFDTAFDGGNVGTTLSGIGTGIGLISGIINARNDRKFKDKLFGLEERRIKRAEAKEDKFQADMNSAWSKK